MPLEYEYRYSSNSYDHDEIVKKLEANGAKMHGHWLFRVQVFTNPNIESNPYIRVRDEGFRTTLTYKTNVGKEFVQEHEVIIDDFDTGCKILLGLGCVPKYYYEKIREIWHIGNAEICWDTNPGRYDIMEVEAKSKKTLEKTIDLLGLKDVPHDNFTDAELYTEPFGIVMPKNVDLTFGTVKKILGPIVTKNKIKFNKLVDAQNKMFALVKKLNSGKVSNKTKSVNESSKKSSKSIKKPSKNASKSTKKPTKKHQKNK